jgi:chromosome segregation ATPase
MDQRTPTTSEVLKFAPKQELRGGSDPAEQAGHAVIAMVREAASISNQNVERAMTLAHKLSVQLRAAEDQIAQLQGEIDRLETRAASAERWLETIKREIEDKLIAPMQANRPELPVRH